MEGEEGGEMVPNFWNNCEGAHPTRRTALFGSARGLQPEDKYGGIIVNLPAR